MFALLSTFGETREQNELKSKCNMKYAQRLSEFSHSGHHITYFGLHSDHKGFFLLYRNGRNVVLIGIKQIFYHSGFVILL